MAFAALLLFMQSGCLSTEDTPLPFPRRIIMRQAHTAPLAGAALPTVGLIVNTRPDNISLEFGRRLAAALQREMELTRVPVRIHCCTEQELALLTPDLQGSPHDVVTVSFQEPISSLPPLQGPVPLQPMPPVLSHLLVVQITEFRPYFPMKATAQITILDGISQQQLFSTTTAWDALRKVPDPMADTVDLHEYFFRESTPCDPSVIHNSPEFLAQIMA
ncbi:MAG: hypothetical protein KDA85_10440, partial [Planctomycetaceae bacterium]|nr:hypothetical protein [Planctomycetaceae bacterium]